jgi:hypothetical protein
VKRALRLILDIIWAEQIIPLEMFAGLALMFAGIHWHSRALIIASLIPISMFLSFFVFAFADSQLSALRRWLSRRTGKK